MSNPIRVLIVDDDAGVRRGLQMRLALAKDMEVVGEASNGMAALGRLIALTPEVVLLDVNMPGMGGIEVCSQMRTEGVAILMLSIDDDEALRARCAAAGAAGFVSKRDSTAQLFAAIRLAARGSPS